MNHRRRILAIAVFALAALLSPTGRVDACGPFFFPDIFIRNDKPDHFAAFVNGHLGLLQPGFDSVEYSIAYRYLNGGSLSAKEQEVVKPPTPNPDLETAQQWQAQQAAEQAAEAASPQNQWISARAEIAGFGMSRKADEFKQPNMEQDASGHFIFNPDYLNCPNPAFTNAVLTLHKRSAAWGNSSPALLDWVHAQDAVFSNCAGKTTAVPAPAPSDAPALLRYDRAYQIAAANFYAKKFDEAAQQFAAIAADKDSPWRDWGTYLAARATVRKAFAQGKTTDEFGLDLASFDPATMKQAQQMLESQLAEPHPALSRDAITSELNFIRIRTEPAKRIAELSAALEGPSPDPYFAQDLADLNWILVKGALNAPQKDNPNYLQTSPGSLPPLLAWIGAWRGLVPMSVVFNNWQQTHALPWLAVAIARADPTDDFVPGLLSAAGQIKPSSPAYQTAFYHRVRLLIGLKRYDEARSLLDPALAATGNNPPDSWRNALLAERLSAARNFQEFLTYAPRTVLETQSQPTTTLQGLCDARVTVKPANYQPAPCPELKQPMAFDADATPILNEKTPLSRLIEAAQSSALSLNLRQNIAIIAWTRAVMLEDAKSAARLVPLLPKPLGITAASGTGFPASLAILRNEGIRPYLEPGIARVSSYSVFDNYHDNWWCQPTRNPAGSVPSSSQSSGLPQWSDQRNWSSEVPAPLLPQPVGIFTPQEQQQAAVESTRLKQLPDSADLLGQRVMDYAKDHPNDPDVPEALHLTVRATRYGCAKTVPNPNNATQPVYSPTSKAAFQLLHRNYPKSAWAAKTPYYY